MSKVSKRARELRSMGDHENFLKRIQKTLYYSRLPSTDRLSLPVTEFASELFSEPRTGRSLDRLHCKDAAYISRQACVSPCSFVLAMLYLERLKACNPDYLQCVAPSELFLVSLMVSSKFLHDYGEEDEVFMDEWALSGKLTVKELIDLEREFLNAILPLCGVINVKNHCTKAVSLSIITLSPTNQTTVVGLQGTITKQWDIFVNETTFWLKLAVLENAVARKQGASRGFFTYTELNTLLSSIDPNILINFFSYITAALVVTYIAGIFTIIGSIFIVSNIPGNCIRPTVELPNTNESTPLEAEPSYKPMDAADVLKTGIILASIKTSAYDSGVISGNVENISWDWWNSSAMNWLSEIAESIESLEITPEYSRYTNDQFVDMSIASSKKLDLEDQLHQGTKVRLQDQLEQSWHKEWTDSIATLFDDYKPFQKMLT